jgi:hypothetical protein
VGEKNKEKPSDQDEMINGYPASYYDFYDGPPDPERLAKRLGPEGLKNFEEKMARINAEVEKLRTKA